MSASCTDPRRRNRASYNDLKQKLTAQLLITGNKEPLGWKHCILGDCPADSCILAISTGETSLLFYGLYFLPAVVTGSNRKNILPRRKAPFTSIPPLFLLQL